MSMQERLNTALYTAKRSAIREFSRLAAATPDCVRLTLGEPDFPTPEPVCATAVEALRRGETHYIENNGALELREKIVAFEVKHGLAYAQDEVIITVGATEALFTAMFGVLNPGDEVIVPTPAFVLYEQIANLCRAAFIPLDTTPDAFQIRPEKLEALVTPRTKAIVLNSPNNPTGCVLNGQSLKAVREAVSGRDIFVICDDVYRELFYGKEYHSFAEFGKEDPALREKILAVQAFSKPWAMTGWRMGYLMAERVVKERLELVHQFAVVSTPAPFQRAGIVALGCDPASMREEYRARRDYVLTRLRGMGLDVTEPEGAFYVFPSIQRLGLDSLTFCTRLLKEAHVAVTPGAAFGGEGHVRVSYCCSREALRKGLDRMEQFIHGL